MTLTNGDYQQVGASVRATLLSLPKEILEIIANYCPSKTRMFLCQANKLFLGICIALTSQTMTCAIQKRDIHTLIRMRQKKGFLATPSLREYALWKVIEYPDEDILMFMLHEERIILQYSAIYKIYFNQMLSKENFKMTQRFIDYTTKYQGLKGMRQSSLLYNSMVNCIPIDNQFAQFDIPLICAAGCERTLVSILGVPTHRNQVFDKIEYLLVICAYYARTDICALLLNNAEKHYSAIIISTWVKRAILVAIACQRNTILSMLEKHCLREDAFSELNYEDRDFYVNYELLIHTAYEYGDVNTMVLLPILIYKEDPMVRDFISALLDDNPREYVDRILGEMLVLATKANKMISASIIIDYISNAEYIWRHLEMIANNCAYWFNASMLEKMLSFLELRSKDVGVVELNRIKGIYKKNYNKVKKAFL
jgi:hypothetical protein